MGIARLVPDAFRHRFDQKIDLPTLPEVIQRILKLLQGDHVALQPVIEIVRRDAILSGRILQLSNTAAVGAKTFGDDINQAILLLGTARLRSVALAVGAISACAHLTPRFPLWPYWVAAATRAGIAQDLAKRCAQDQQAAFTIGLTGSLGRLVIGHVVPEAQDRLLAVARKLCQSYHDSAREIGFDDAAIGAWMLESWGISTVAVDAVASQWRPVEELSQLAVIGQIAHAIADAGAMTRLPGDFDDFDPGRLRALLSRLDHAVNLEEFLSVRTVAYESARALVDCARG